MLRQPTIPETLIAAALLCTLGCAGGGDPTNPNRRTPVKPPDGAVTDPGGKPAVPVSFVQEEPWSSGDGNYEAGFGFDQPTKKQPGETPDDRPIIVYARPKDYTKLVIDLYCSTDKRSPDQAAGAGDGPLASLASVQVFGPEHDKPIAVFARAQLAYTRKDQPGFEHDGRGPVVSTLERIRIPFGAHAALVRNGHPYSFTVVALDAQGRSMAVEDIEGDEASEPIAPPQR